MPRTARVGERARVRARPYICFPIGRLLMFTMCATGMIARTATEDDVRALVSPFGQVRLPRSGFFTLRAVF